MARVILKALKNSVAKLYFYYSSMNAGKSTTLLQSAHNYRERGLTPLLFTPQLDTRAGQGRIASRIGLETEARTFTPPTIFINSPCPPGLLIACSSMRRSFSPARRSTN